MIQSGFLSEEDRMALTALARDGSSPCRVTRRANALVLLDEGWSCQQVAHALLLDDDTIDGWRKLFEKRGIEGITSFVGRCCTENFKSEVWALSPRSCGFLGGTDGIRATGPKHAIQNRDADGGFGLLTCKGPCPKLRANNPFVSTHRGFHERASAIAGRLLPFQSPFGLDQGDMAITL